MTTFNMTGFSIEYDTHDDPIAVDTASLSVTFPDDQAVLDRTIFATPAEEMHKREAGGLASARGDARCPALQTVF